MKLLLLKLAVYGALALAPLHDAKAATTYDIEAAVNDEKFIIDGEVYEAQTWCMNWSEGEQVIFLDGTPGICTSAELFNVNRRDTCKVWCE